jgi:hypothetical protein
VSSYIPISIILLVASERKHRRLKIAPAHFCQPTKDYGIENEAASRKLLGATGPFISFPLRGSSLPAIVLSASAEDGS